MTINGPIAERGGDEQEESVAGFYLFTYLMGSLNMRAALHRELIGRVAELVPEQTQIMYRGASIFLGAYVESLPDTPSAAELSRSIRGMTKGARMPLDYLDQMIAWHLDGSAGLFEAEAEQVYTAASMSILLLHALDLPTAEVRELIRRAESETRALGIELTPMWKRTSGEAVPEPDPDAAAELRSSSLSGGRRWVSRRLRVQTARKLR